MPYCHDMTNKYQIQTGADSFAGVIFGELIAK
ncbi:hypothetical protein L914_08824 [Phytophthora nicotianae]|uniref:Uncharacterized protein n=1 Tax=Phytophthora nicotianae TaxID=4792 RepID=W2JN22_PHYNI|nr:hypothetical protein L916_02471 [Phytophthora nicotianae]ETM46256.1 hypothetical protein L914_08824 [Phytophthora nicotianae]